ncbi:hypothetical protein ACQP1K_03300 [Sphaerimonospora sp. CA-214678]|uniref:hypothetical protein n=1 Tax=Sphaerimonospora sp. CA-214678 TaxID=3240029 RepID=UPI003D8A81CF
MGPELHYELMKSLSAERREEAARQRLIRRVRAAKKEDKRSDGARRRTRADSGELSPS